MTTLTDTVADVLRGHAGPGVPDVFRRVYHAQMEPGLPVTITADLVMFDGVPGRVRIGQFTIAGTASRWATWLGTGGGAVSFEDGQWVRLDLDGNPVLPLFRTRTLNRERDDD